MAAVAAQRRESRKFAAVTIQDCRLPRSQQLGKQPFLGGAVLPHVAVIVEMIAGQIGKASSGNREAVEAKLGETMARRLDRDVLDPLFAEGGEIAVEGDRVGRRQRARAASARPHQPERADTRREMAAGGAYLTK